MTQQDPDPELPHGFLTRLRSGLDRTLPPEVRASDEFDLHRARLLVASSLLSTGTSFASIGVIGLGGPGEQRAVAVAAVCMASTLPLLWWTRSLDWAAHSTTAGLFAYGVLSLWSSGGALPFPALMFPIAALTAGLLCTRRAALAWVAAQLVAMPAAALLSPAAPAATLASREPLWAGLLFSLPVLIAVRLYRDLFERVLAERIAATREARAAAERQALLDARLRQSELETGLGRMAGGIAHEFNNILAAIAGSAELLGLSQQVGARERELTARIGTAVDRAARLVRLLLDFTGRGRRRLEPFALSERVTKLEPLLRAGLSKQTTLSLSVRADAELRADPTQIEQLIVQLVQNAERAYGGKAGEIWVETDFLALAAPATAVPADALPPGSYAVLRVIDRGRGIDPEQAAHIFEPFYSGFEGGRGLGLSAALGIARSHGGGIAVDSALGTGTTVSVYLPSAAGEAARASPERTPARVPLAAQCLLVVDDEPSVRAVLVEYLEASGARVPQAPDGAAALALLPRLARVDAAFVDVSMPNLGGVGLLEALRSAGRVFPVVLMTGHDELDLTRFEGEAQVALLRKPFPLEEVANALGRAASGSSALGAGAGQS